MSLTLAPSNTVSMEEIDAELDRFNDEMSILGYDATVRFAKWGEPVIDVHTDQQEPIIEFWLSVDSLDDFRHYANRTIDMTSIPRAELKEALGG